MKENNGRKYLFTVVHSFETRKEDGCGKTEIFWKFKVDQIHYTESCQYCCQGLAAVDEWQQTVFQT